jgi:hypothetical protein
MNAAFAIAFRDLISHVQLTPSVIMVLKQLEYSTFSRIFWPIIICEEDGLLEKLVIFLFYHIHFYSTSSSNLN